MPLPAIGSPEAAAFYTQINAPQANTIKEEPKKQEISAVLKTQPDNDTFKPSLFDSIMEKVVNPRDLNDTVHVPRSIFKGYLSFMVGTAIASMGTLIKNIKPFGKELSAIPNICTAVSIALTAIGTFEFVKPFMVKEKPKTEETAQV